VKEFEVSFWGNLAIEETYEIEHTGAKLTGPFSRYDYQRIGSPTAIEFISETLPVGSNGIYYRDEIGNISTSHVRPMEGGQFKFEVGFRYVLFGGWKVSYYTGYNLPLENYLRYDVTNSNHYYLNVSFAKSFDQPISIDHETVRIILPEGASNIKLHTPFLVEETSESKHWTYLDTSGRPVFIMKKSNLISLHDQFFQVEFTFSKYSILQEPCLLIIAYFLFFFLVIVYVRIDLTISPSTIPTEEVPAKRINSNQRTCHQAATSKTIF